MTAARQSLIKIHQSIRLALIGQAVKETPYIRISILIMFEWTNWPVKLCTYRAVDFITSLSNTHKTICAWQTCYFLQPATI